MVEIPLFDQGGALQPREDVRIESVRVQAYPDRRRVFAEIKVTPFRERPNLILTLHDERDQIVAELNIIETMHNSMEFTMHLRGKDDTTGAYALTVTLYYESKNPPHDENITGFAIPPLNTDTLADAP
jgi:hypothetical protein